MLYCFLVVPYYYYKHTTAGNHVHVDVSWVYARDPRAGVKGHEYPAGEGTAIATKQSWKYYLSAKKLMRTLTSNLLGDEKTTSFCKFYYYLCRNLNMMKNGLCPWHDWKLSEAHVEFWQHEWRKRMRREISIPMQSFVWQEQQDDAKRGPQKRIVG
jgi:hypothetical protein